MKKKKAIDILKYHNQWRRGAKIAMGNPIEIGKAIEKVLKVAKRANKKKKKNA